MTRWYISPEVAGQLGEHTRLDPSQHPPIVMELHYEFDGWLGDDLLEGFPCFLVTEKLAEALKGSELTGWRLKDVAVSKSAIFEDLYPERDLPRFRWLIVDGQQNDDFSLADSLRLEVSDRALDLLRTHAIDHAIIETVPLYEPRNN
jgi:hypothetical protein